MAGSQNLEESDVCMDEPKIGMKFNSEKEAYDFYNRYALRYGFSVRHGNKRYWQDGSYRQRDFLCSKEGHREFEPPTEVHKYSRNETRTGCKAMIRFTIEDNIWVVSSLNLEHNHELANEGERCNLRSGRKVTDAYGATVKSMVSAGIKPMQSFSFLTKEVGGHSKVGFTTRDLHNFLKTERDRMIEAGDGQSVINYFQKRHDEDPMFTYSVQVDQFNRMSNFFWRDGRSKIDFEAFGDVVVFDTTYRTNRYDLICAPFVGINHHWKNILFGCAFLLDETTSSFTWLFEEFKASMGGRQPKCIFTDQDQAMSNAIEKVFPLSHHRLCLWHILQNAKKHLARYYSNSDFYGKFSKFFTGYLSEEEFETNWAEMIKSHNLEKHDWLQRLYNLRKKWCPTFSKDIFSAKMKSTQRSESTNSVFHQIMKTSMSLVQVLKFYEQKAEGMRQDERNDDYHSKNGTPAKVHNFGGILSHAASVYTLRLYKIFEEEFLDATGIDCSESKKNEMVLTYKMRKINDQTEYIVRYDQSTFSISCSCKLFESMGMLCSHILRAFIVNNVNQIPSKYVVDRWTKAAKNRIPLISAYSSIEHEKTSRTVRLSELNHLGQIVFDKGSADTRSMKIVQKKLMEALELLQKESEDADITQNIGGSVMRKSSGMIDQVPILNPPRVRRKGLTNARIKSQLEKKSKKKRKNMNTNKETFHPSSSEYDAQAVYNTFVDLSSPHILSPIHDSRIIHDSIAVTSQATTQNVSFHGTQESSSSQAMQSNFSFVRLLQESESNSHNI